MASFQDKNNNRWDVELTVAIARRVFDISKPDSLTAVLEDPYQRFDLLWMLCEQQAAKLSIDQSAFDLLVADEATYVAANEALLEALQAFFPPNRQRVPGFADEQDEGSGLDVGQDGDREDCGDGSDFDPSDYESAGASGSGDYEGWQLVFELAGIIGVNPDPLTLRHLQWMAVGRQSVAWDHTCSIMSAIINRGRKSHLVRPNQLHPMRRKQVSNFDSETIREYSAALKAREEAKANQEGG